MRSVVAFVLTFGASIFLLGWMSEELRVLPRGPGWLVLCFMLASFSARSFRKGGKVDDLGSNMVAVVAERVAHFAPPSAADETLWAQAVSEFDGPDRRPGLYAKALAHTAGDHDRAKAYYLKARVAELKTANICRSSASSDGSPKHSPEGSQRQQWPTDGCSSQRAIGRLGEG